MSKRGSIISIHAFNEIIDNMEHVEKLTLYGRRSIKYYVKNMQQKLEDIERYINSEQWVKDNEENECRVHLLEILEKGD